MAILSIRHLTRYRYRRPVRFGEHRMMLRPLEGPDQRIISADLLISPSTARLRHQQDSHGAWTSVASFDAQASSLVVESRVRIEHTPLPAFVDDGLDVWAAGPAFAYEADDLDELRSSTARGAVDVAVGRWARRFAGPGASLAATLTEMTVFIHQRFAYRRRLESGTQAPEETLRLESGCCRDFTVLMIEAARSLGLGARYVLGYIHSGAEARDGSMAPREANWGGHTHAWARIFLPSSGWVDFDPTNGIVGGGDLIRVAVTRSPSHASPLSGSWDGEADDYLGMDVAVEVCLESEARGRKLDRSAARACATARQPASAAA